MIRLDPATLTAIGDLEIAARMLVDGFMFGGHPSRMQGAGIEFSQYRNYQPGDDLRRVDWKLFARSDRYFVRESEAETSVTIRIVLDASDSMREEEDGVSKFACARLLAAALAMIAFRQGDAVGLTAVSQGGARAWRADRGRSHLNRLLLALSAIEPGGSWPDWHRLEGPLLAAPAREIVIAITDLNERGNEIRAALEKLSALRHDVRVLHLVGRREMTFDYDPAVTFEELETGRTLDVATGAVRERYLASLSAALRNIDLELGEHRIGCHRIRTDQPLDEALREALSARSRR